MEEPVTSYQQWIEKGYEAFARSGPDGIKVQTLAREMGVSKSSFYHHFGDQQSFVELLLEEHSHIMKQFAPEIRLCKAIDPDFIDLVMRYKTIILFQQQLRIHSENTDFQRCYEGVTDGILKEVVDVWAKYMGVTSDLDLARKLYLMVITLFYERVREHTFSKEWILGMLAEVREMCDKVVKAKS